MRDETSENVYALLLSLNQQWTKPEMNPLQVIRNEFFHKLGSDHIAVDQSGTPIARAGDRATVEKAAPNAAGYFSAADFLDLTPGQAAPVDDGRKAYEADQLAAEPVKIMPSTGLVDTPKPIFEAPMPEAIEAPPGLAVQVPTSETDADPANPTADEHPDADKLN